jgi:AcrR family transcriptional regulator
MKSAVRHSGTKRREQIALAALKIIGEQGLASLSTATLAAQVGLSSGGLFRHFASIEEILQEATRIAVGMLDATFPEPDLPPIERIRKLGLNRVKLLGLNPGLTWLLMSKQAYLKLPADSVEHLKMVKDRSKQFLLSAVQDGVSEGSIRSDIKPKALLVTILGTVHTLIGMPNASGERIEFAEEVMDSLLIMLRPGALTE